MPGVLNLIRTLEERGFTVEVAGDKVRVRPPTADAVEEARPILEELRQRKAEVLAILRQGTPPAPCPACGIAPAELETARRKRALDRALADCEAHLARCRTCRGWGGPYCPDMEALREAHYQAWARYYGQPEGAWDPWR